MSLAGDRWSRSPAACSGLMKWGVPSEAPPLGPVEPVDRAAQGLPADQPHGIERAAVGMPPEAVDRDDAGMLQGARDLGLEQEPRPAVRVVRDALQDLLQGDLALQLVVERE